MPLSAFVEKNHQPIEDDLREMLGRAHAHWRKLLALVAERITPVAEVWAFTSTNGWGLRIRHKDRIILYMTPQRNQFLVSFALGDKAIAAAKAAGLPETILEAIASAPRYAEGTGVRMTITNGRQIAALATLAEIKWRH